MSINYRVRELRKTLNLTQKDFGNKICVAQTYLSQIENGGKDVTEKIAQLIVLQFNVNKNWLYHGSGEMFIEKDRKQKELLYLFNELSSSHQDHLINTAKNLLHNQSNMEFNINT